MKPAALLLPLLLSCGCNRITSPVEPSALPTPTPAPTARPWPVAVPTPTPATGYGIRIAAACAGVKPSWTVTNVGPAQVVGWSIQGPGVFAGGGTGTLPGWGGTLSESVPDGLLRPGEWVMAVQSGPGGLNTYRSFITCDAVPVPTATPTPTPSPRRTCQPFIPC